MQCNQSDKHSFSMPRSQNTTGNTSYIRQRRNAVVFEQILISPDAAVQITPFEDYKATTMDNKLRQL